MTPMPWSKTSGAQRGFFGVRWLMNVDIFLGPKNLIKNKCIYIYIPLQFNSLPPWTVFGESNLFQPSCVMGELLKFTGVCGVTWILEKSSAKKSLVCPDSLFHLQVSFPDLDLDSGQIGGTLSWSRPQKMKFLMKLVRGRNMRTNFKNKPTTGITLALLNWSFWRLPVEDSDCRVLDPKTQL